MKKILFLAFAFLLAGMPTLTQASTSTQSVIFSEVAWAGSSLSNSDEWLELSNVSSQSIDISGWQIEGASTTALTIPNETSLKPYSTYLISNYDETHENSSLNRTPNFTSTSVSLSNSKLGLILKDNSGAEVDVAGNAGAPFAGGTGNSGGADDGQFSSMVRRGNGLGGSEPEAWESSVASNGFKTGLSELGTPGSLESWFAQTVLEPQQEVETPELEPTPAEETPTTQPEPETEKLSTKEVIAEDIYDSTVVSLQINEFVSSPEAGMPEWIELVNRSTEPVNTVGWTVEDSTGKQTPLPETDVKPIEYLVIENPLAKLNNSGDSIILRNPDGVIVDKVEYGTEKIPAPKTGSSMIRNVYKGFVETFIPTPGDHNKLVETKPETTPPVVESEAQQIQTVIIPEMSPTAANVQTAEVAVNAANIKLSEIYPNTLGQDEKEEYIKLFNFGETRMFLKGWSIQDASGKTFTFKTEVINPNSELTVKRSDSKITLNNTSETVQLLDPNGLLVDQKTYENAKQGAKIVLTNGQWIWTGDNQTNESKTLPNNSSATTSSNKSVGTTQRSTSTYNSVLIETAKSLPDDSKVTLTGHATVGEKVMSSQTLYMNDETGGIQVYKNDAVFPDVSEGQKIQVSGVLSTSRGERRVKLTGEQSIVLDDELVSPSFTALNSLDSIESRVGSLVQVNGIVVSRTNSLALLEDTSNDWTIAFSDGANIDPTVFSSGTTVAVTGILTRVGDSYKIKPRSMNDVTVKEVEQNQVVAGTSGIDKNNNTQTLFGYAILGGVALVLTGLWMLRNRKSIKNNYGQEPAYSA